MIDARIVPMSDMTTQAFRCQVDTPEPIKSPQERTRAKNTACSRAVQPHRCPHQLWETQGQPLPLRWTEQGLSREEMASPAMNTHAVGRNTQKRTLQELHGHCTRGTMRLGVHWVCETQTKSTTDHSQRHRQRASQLKWKALPMHHAHHRTSRESSLPNPILYLGIPCALVKLME